MMLWVTGTTESGVGCRTRAGAGDGLQWRAEPRRHSPGARLSSPVQLGVRKSHLCIFPWHLLCKGAHGRQGKGFPPLSTSF